MQWNFLKLLPALAFVFASVAAIGQDDDKLKELAREKAMLEAQTARDVAEAAKIKAAAELAKAKSGAADVDTNALQAKAARDQAEAAALTAAKALADAKIVASIQVNQTQKAQAESEVALATAMAAAQAADYSGVKAIFGNAPNLGTDGNITLSDATTGMLLESKSGSLKATAQLAEGFCEVLKARSVSNAFIAPADLERKVVSSSFVLREFRDLLREADSDNNKNVVGGVGSAQLAPAALLSAVSMLQYGAGAVQSIAKLFKSDYTIGLADARRETWFQYFAAARCPAELGAHDIEAKIRALGFDEEMKQINRIAAFHDAAVSQKLIQTRKLEALKAAIKKLEDAKEKVSQGAVSDMDTAQTSIDALARLDGRVARMKAFVEMVANKPDAFMDAVVWDRFSTAEYKDRPRITLVLTTQDGQVTKSHWLTGKRIYGRSSGELVYRVIDPKGKVIAVGYLVATNSDGEINFSMNAKPVADGLEFPIRQKD